ncbi:hypothetical protein [Ruania alba]|uniref:Uncharacterized protein n=1 Tax=Ruania alba TaxID=648782 RepID=A0A1H5NK42_9MICO|nr:hypothetical protein [Ruania alba]SEF01078.1 hypothetical protein SAMN04488554_4351 [Ruania alba]
MFPDDVFDAIAARRMGGPLDRPHRHRKHAGRRLGATDDFTAYDPPRRPRPEGL